MSLYDFLKPNIPHTDSLKKRSRMYSSYSYGRVINSTDGRDFLSVSLQNYTCIKHICINENTDLYIIIV